MTPIINALESCRLALVAAGINDPPKATAISHGARLSWCVIVDTDHFASLRAKHVGGIADTVEDAARLLRQRLAELIVEKREQDARRAKRQTRKARS